MGRTNIAFFEGSMVSGTPTTHCDDVTFNPPDNAAFTPVTVTLTTTTAGAHIFYRLAPQAQGNQPPTHSGDNATGATVRFGTNQGTVNTGSGSKAIRAVAYRADLLDSNITIASYDPFTPP